MSVALRQSIGLKVYTKSKMICRFPKYRQVATPYRFFLLHKTASPIVPLVRDALEKLWIWSNFRGFIWILEAPQSRFSFQITSWKFDQMWNRPRAHLMGPAQAVQLNRSTAKILINCPFKKTILAQHSQNFSKCFLVDTMYLNVCLYT